jgi:tRNA(adenine34) deaminase
MGDKTKIVNLLPKMTSGFIHPRLSNVNNIELMTLALEEAAKAGEDVPVGAILINAEGDIIARGHNRKEALQDPTSHAEIEVIRTAAQALGDWRLTDCTLIVTLEPCAMCAAAIVAARIPKVVFGAWDQRVGAAGSIMDILRDQRLGKPVEVIPGVLEKECAAVLKAFFDQKR